MGFVLVLSAGIGIEGSAPAIAPIVPRVHGAIVRIDLTGCGVVAGGCIATGWNGTTSKPNPDITVTQGDTIAMNLRSGDGMIHRFLVDTDVDDQDTTDCPLIDPCSNMFASTTAYTFTVNFAPGNYTYLCSLHPYVMVGNFIVKPSGTVGGDTVSSTADKVNTLAVYIMIALAVIGMIVTTAVYVRRRIV